MVEIYFLDLMDLLLYKLYDLINFSKNFAPCYTSA